MPSSFQLAFVMNRSLTIKTGQTHVQRYREPLRGQIEVGDIDTKFVISHRLNLQRQAGRLHEGRAEALPLAARLALLLNGTPTTGLPVGQTPPVLDSLSPRSLISNSEWG